MQYEPATIATSVLNARDILKEIGSGYDANLHAASISARMWLEKIVWDARK